MDRSIATESAILHNGNGIDIIGANPSLAQAARWMVTQTNAELRLRRKRLAGLRSRYDFILIDTCPGLGSLLNSSLNAADQVVIPVDPGFFGYMGIQELQREMAEIREGTNPDLNLLGLVMTLSERTVVARETFDALVGQFGDLVFESQIRRCVALRESAVFGKSILLHAPKSSGAEDYSQLTLELLVRVESVSRAHHTIYSPFWRRCDLG